MFLVTVRAVILFEGYVQLTEWSPNKTIFWMKATELDEKIFHIKNTFSAEPPVRNFIRHAFERTA